MKFRSKFLAMLMALILVFSVLGSVAVSATETEDQYTKDDIQMIADLYGMSFDEVLTQLGLTEDDLVESSTVSGTDPVAYSYTDLISSLKLNKQTTSAHGISYKLPEGGEIYSLDDGEAELYKYTGTTKQELMNTHNIIEIAEYADELTKAVVYYQFTALKDTAYGRYVGNMNKLSTEDQQALVDIKVEGGTDANNTYTTKKNGQVYLVARIDSDQMADSGICTTEADITTIINGTIYTAYIYIQHGGTATDAAVVDEIINSFTVKGEMSKAASTRVLAITAVSIIIFLFIIIAFLVFFIVRFSIFSKASGSRFNIIGFSMPKKVSVPAAASKHTFRANTGVKDSLEEESDSEE